MNDADSGMAARVWRSPLSSTTPSTGIPARRPRRRRARSCLSLTPFSRNPRDRSTLRTLPGRESTYETHPRGLVVPYSLPLQIIVRLSPPRPIASPLCAQVVASVCLRCNERRPRRNETTRSRVSDLMQIIAAVCGLAFSLHTARRDTSDEYVKRLIASRAGVREASLCSLLTERRMLP